MGRGKAKPAAFCSIKAAAAGFRLRHCPATCNLVTTMDQVAWTKLCTATRRNETALLPSGRERRIKSFCTVCQGAILPPGLTIQSCTQEIKQRENTMASSKTKGKCESCGQLGLTLGQNYGIKMCSTCAAIYGHVSKRPAIVSAAIERIGKLAEFQGALLGAAVSVSVPVESEALGLIAAAIGYEGESGDGLVAAVRECRSLQQEYKGTCEGLSLQLGAMEVERQKMRDCLGGVAEAVGYEEDLDDGLDGLLDSVRDFHASLEGYLDRNRKGHYFDADLLRALDCSHDEAYLAALQIAALLEDQVRTNLATLEIANSYREQLEADQGKEAADPFLEEILRILDVADTSALLEAISTRVQSYARYQQHCETLTEQLREADKMAAWQHAFFDQIREALDQPLLPVGEIAPHCKALRASVGFLPPVPERGDATKVRVAPSFESHLLDLTLAMLDGRVTGVAAAFVSTLREAA